MSDNEILNGLDTTEKAKIDAAEETITLESILREYDEKRALRLRKEAEKERSDADSWSEFEKKLRASAVVSEPSDASEPFEVSEVSDDSDMKIADFTSPHETNMEDMLRNFETKEAGAVEPDGLAESSSENVEKDHRKRDIMSEISKHFEEKATETSAEPQTGSDTTDAEQLPESETEAISVGADEAAGEQKAEPEKQDESENAEHDENHSHRRARKPIDDSALLRAFDEDGYDIYSGKSKKKKNDNDSTQSFEKTPKQTARRFDENGERVCEKSKYFTPAFEYTAESNPEELRGILRKKLLGSCLALAAVLLLTIVSLYVESAPSLGLPHAKALEAGRSGRIFVLFDLQILFFAVILKLNGICKGIAALGRLNVSSESVAFVNVLAATLHSVALAVSAPTRSTLPLLCAVACFSVLALAFSDFLKARTEYMSFRIVSGEGDKIGFSDITASGETTSDEIVKFVPEGSTVLDIRKTGFAEDFFKRNCEPNSADKNTSLLITIALVASVVGGVLYYIFNKELLDAFCGAVSVFMTSVQMCMLIASSLPEAVFAGHAARRKCAFVGHNLCDEYDNVSVISFKDTEVFAPKDVKVTNIRTYGDTRIDNMIVTMARIFGHIGGPLSAVFSNSVSAIPSCCDDVKIVDVAPDGLWCKVDGDNVYIGTTSYMAENNFEISSEPADDSFRQTNGAILYLASSGRVMAKFYIKYTLNPSFESVLRSLYTQGICARIKTMDPCINNDFIRAGLRRPECLFSVVKAQSPDEIEKEEGVLSSGLISGSGEHSLIYSFLLVCRLKAVLRVTGTVKLLSFGVGLGLSLLMLLGGSSVISPIAVLLLQLFWLIPIFVVTRLAAK